MTKRPQKEAFIEAWEEASGNVSKLADVFNASSTSVYNWLSMFKSEIKVNGKDILTDEEEEEEDLTFDEYVERYKNSLTQPREREVDISLNKSCLIACISDTHFGSAYTDAVRIQEDKNLISETDNVFALFVGDLIDYVPSSPHKTISYEQVFPQATQSKGMALKYVKELGHKILLMLSGCHMNWEYAQTGEYFTEEAAQQTVSKQFFPDAVVLNLTVGKISYKLYLSHKIGGGSSYNPAHAMYRRAREMLDFDCGITAHKHTPAIAVQNIRQKDVTVINCGTYKKVGTFANKVGYIQQPLSIPGIYIDAEKRKIIPFFDWRDGLALLK